MKPLTKTVPHLAFWPPPGLKPPLWGDQSLLIPVRWNTLTALKRSDDAHGGKFSTLVPYNTEMTLGNLECNPGSTYSYGIYAKGKGKVTVRVIGWAIEGPQNIAETNGEAGADWTLIGGEVKIPSHLRTFSLSVIVINSKEQTLIDDAYIACDPIHTYSHPGIEARAFQPRLFRMPQLNNNAFSGAKFVRLYTMMNDKLDTADVMLKWELLAPDGKSVLTGKDVVTGMKTGYNHRGQIELQLPKVASRTRYTLNVRMYADGKFCFGRQLDVDLWPAQTAPEGELKRSVVLFDPAGSTAKILERMGIKFQTINTPVRCRSSVTSRRLSRTRRDWKLK